MDFNVVVLCGHLAADPELREFESGSRLLRYLITVRTEQPRRRVDVLPVTLWDPSEEQLAGSATRGDRVFAVAAAQRRFWDAGRGRKSTVELVAQHLEIRDPDSEEQPTPG